MTILTKGRKLKWLAAGLVVLVAVAAAGTAIARSGRAGADTDPAADVLSRIDSHRLATIRAVGGTAIVEARASQAGADSARSLWYGTLASAAFAQKAGANSVSRRVVGANGALLTEETDAVASAGSDAFRPLDRSVADIVAGARGRAASLGARLLSAHYIRLFGGTAELVVQPGDPSGFVASGGANVAALLGDLASDKRPYLVTVVDQVGEPILVLGYTPNVGGGIGQGIGWQAPNANSDAIWGATDLSHRLP